MAIDLAGRWALVTGASSGFGVDFAELLAERGANLVLTARREDRLRALAEDLAARHGIECRVIAADLAATDGARQLWERAKADVALAAGAGDRIDVVINNAGFGAWGEFTGSDWQRLSTLLQVDVVALTELTHLAARDMKQHGRGWILQVASLGAFQPTPLYAVYAAAKAYVQNFGEAVDQELRGTGVHVCVLSPGVTRTEFLEVAGQAPNLYQRLVMMNSRPVAAAGLRALFRGRRAVVPGIGNKLTALSVRFVPRRLQARLAGWVMQ